MDEILNQHGKPKYIQAVTPIRGCTQRPTAGTPQVFFPPKYIHIVCDLIPVWKNIHCGSDVFGAYVLIDPGKTTKPQTDP